MTRVHIACSAKNAARWIDPFIEGLVAQTHTDWELWIRDDGSTDDTRQRLEAWQRRDPRVAHIIAGENSLGLSQAFADVLARLPAEARAVATADADDVWMPHRIASTLATLTDAEETQPGPVLVHTDLQVVDERLALLAPSFWESQGIHPQPPSLQSLAIQNVATGPTLLFNGALLALVRTIPAAVTNHDWWIALVAMAAGRIIAVPECTVWYRQHGANSTEGARRSAWRRLRGAWERRAIVRRDVDRMARQAGALAQALGDRISADDRRMLAGLAGIAERSGWARRAAILRWRWLASHGVARNLGVVLRG
ncbi:MAG: glycosyltransferase [Gemmatimonadetes bacterium]|nr:glycosyltransferase [Gemmatimonadota bacterium]